jgi:colanic acid/amylovoran biosynthesis protein
VLIEIRKAGFINKGAQLMLRATMQAISTRIPSARFTVTPSSSDGDQPISSIASEGLTAKLSVARAGLELGNLARFVPSRLRSRYGVSLDREVDVVLDAAGFCYGAPWPSTNLAALATASRRWRQQGTKLILLPQSFGDFTDSSDRTLMQRIGENCSHIFVRDDQSHRGLSNIVDADTLSASPDFTVSLPGIAPLDPTRYRDTVAIVPNAKMLHRTDESTRNRYLPCLAECISIIESLGMRSAIVLHELKMDRSLGDELAACGRSVELIVENDPQRIKGILGACHATIGSRYHGLVSSLSQGVPSLATSWSHKYQQLFADYGCEENLIDVRDASTTKKAVEQLVSSDVNAPARSRLLPAAEKHRKRAEAMWDKVAELITKPKSRP